MAGENPTTLKPCPFCGSLEVGVVTRDVEPQGDPWYGKKLEMFVECHDCSAALFNQYWHDGFSTEMDAIAAWNRRAA